jgi:hypothetical protein
MHGNDVSLGQRHVKGRKQKQRAGEVAVHPPASGGVRQARDAHDYKRRYPQPRPRTPQPRSGNHRNDRHTPPQQAALCARQIIRFATRDGSHRICLLTFHFAPLSTRNDFPSRALGSTRSWANSTVHPGVWPRVNADSAAFPDGRRFTGTARRRLLPILSLPVP